MKKLSEKELAKITGGQSPTLPKPPSDRLIGIPIPEHFRFLH